MQALTGAAEGSVKVEGAAGTAGALLAGKPASPAAASATDVCYHCAQAGHWKQDCPLLRKASLPEELFDQVLSKLTFRKLKNAAPDEAEPEQEEQEEVKPKKQRASMADLMSAPKKKAKGKGKPKVTWKPAVVPGRRSVTPDLGATQRNSL